MKLSFCCWRDLLYVAIRIVEDRVRRPNERRTRLETAVAAAKKR